MSNTKADLVAYVEHDINRIVLKSKAKTILAGAEQVPEKAEALRKAVNEVKADLQENFGFPDAKVEKLMRQSPKLKPLIEELERLDNAEGRIYESAMLVLRKRIPERILANLDLTYTPNPEAEDGDLPIYIKVGKMRKGGNPGPRGFQAEHQGNTYEYSPSSGKHGVSGRLKVYDSKSPKAGEGVVTITKDKKSVGKHAVKSFSGASRHVHKAAGLLHGDGKPWIPPNSVWQTVKGKAVKVKAKA